MEPVAREQHIDFIFTGLLTTAAASRLHCRSFSGAGADIAVSTSTSSAVLLSFSVATISAIKSMAGSSASAGATFSGTRHGADMIHLSSSFSFSTTIPSPSKTTKHAATPRTLRHETCTMRGISLLTSGMKSPPETRNSRSYSATTPSAERLVVASRRGVPTNAANSSPSIVSTSQLRSTKLRAAVQAFQS